MIINLERVKIRDIYEGYVDHAEEGVRGYSGLLNIRPKYQREFVYKDKQRDAVIDTIKKDLPLNIMYWVKNQDGTYEVLDGQQRTISACSYIDSDFSINYQAFHNLTEEEQEQILDYELMIYVCEGTEREKLNWFKIINIAGEKLTEQELRNAIYTGSWLTAAKDYFSKTNCPATKTEYKQYLKGSAIRQDYLETAIEWIAHRDGIKVEEYMARKQHEKDAEELWLYFQDVFHWVGKIFVKYRKEMRGIPWGKLYNDNKDKVYNPKEIEEEIQRLLLDDDVSNKKGIYPFIITGEERHLNIRSFSASIKRQKYEEQKGICPICNEEFDINEMEGDHITPWSLGGKTELDNCQMLCKPCNRKKSNR